MDVSFLLWSQDSRLTPLRALQFYVWAEFPQAFKLGSKATHQLASPKYNAQRCAIRILETLFYCSFIYGLDGLVVSKRVILVTGTPCVGKTTVSRLLASKLNALYLNLTELAVSEKLISGKDEERKSIVVDEKRMRQKIGKIIKNSSKKDVVIDGHYAVSVVPKKLVTYIFVLRRDPVELRKSMENCGFSRRKLWENLASEILDVCLVEALNVYEEGNVCELNASGRGVEEVVGEILDVLGGHKKCRVGIVDWLGKLETEGLLNDYLKI